MITQSIIIALMLGIIIDFIYVAINTQEYIRK